MEQARRARGTIGATVFPLLLVLSCVGGCATAKDPGLLTAEEWRRAITDREVRLADVPNPIAPSPQMVAVARETAAEGSPLQQLERLQQYLFDESVFAFDYRARRTLTAAEAFAERSGNCVSFTNMFIAMGRSLGLEVQAALAQIPRETETLGNLVLVNSHVVAMLRHSQGRAIFDFDRNRQSKPLGYLPIDDLHLTAIFLNNIGAEKLLSDEPDAAIAFFENAVRLAPDLAATHSNLGVAFQRIGDLEAALDTYLLALQHDPRDLSTRNNLQGLFVVTVRERRTTAGDAGTLVPGERDRLLSAGDAELAAGRTVSAERFYRQAIKSGPAGPQPYVATARVLLYRGQVRAARKMLQKALALDHGNVEARRLLRGLEHR